MLSFHPDDKVATRVKYSYVLLPIQFLPGTRYVVQMFTFTCTACTRALLGPSQRVLSLAGQTQSFQQDLDLDCHVLGATFLQKQTL